MANHVLDNEMDKIESGPIDSEQQLRNILTNTMSISPELFERLYLGPQTKISGDLRTAFANPTPLGVLGFAVGLFPLSIEFMGWRGSGGVFGTQTTTCSLFFGGALLWIAGAGEWILGNTFPYLVFFAFGAHFFTFASTFIPWYGAIAFSSGGDPFEATATFNAGFGFYPIAMAMLSFIFLLCALRTNLVFVLIFLCATIGFSLAGASVFFAAMEQMSYSTTLLVATGGMFFAADLLGWYLLFAQMLAIMELPLPDIPVLDLSNIIKAKSRLKAE